MESQSKPKYNANWTKNNFKDYLPPRSSIGIGELMWVGTQIELEVICLTNQGNSTHYSLEVDGIPVTFDGDAAIPALSGVSAQIGLDSIVPPVITIPAGSYYMTAHCVDLDGDDITVTVNDITIGPIAGEVSAGALIVVGESVNETIDVTISWTDGSDTLIAMVTVNLESDAALSPLPGFGVLLGLCSILLAGFAVRRKYEI